MSIETSFRKIEVSKNGCEEKKYKDIQSIEDKAETVNAEMYLIRYTIRG